MPPGTSPVLSFFIDAYRTPPFLLPIYLAAAERYAVPWQVLAAINEVESDYGFDLGVSSAGAEGWMQFLPTEWSLFGVDANGAGVRDPYNPADAIFAAARYLAGAGAAHDLRDAINAYNHSWSYVESVLLRARLLATTPQSMIDGLAAIVDGRAPLANAIDLVATPVWAAPQRRTTAHAPSPAAAASEVGASRPSIVGADITASPGTPVLAVQAAEVIAIGRSAKLGRFIELRDVYGDTYTYAKLGRVLTHYALPSQPQPTGSGPPGHARVSGSARVRIEPLRKGTWVAPATALGHVTGRTHSRFLFEVQPAGTGPIDPRPVLDAWRALDETQGTPQRGTQPLFGPSAHDALIGEIQLMSERQLELRLLSDPSLRISACGRADIEAGHIEKPVLDALNFLVASGLDPTISTLRCNHAGVGASAGRLVHTRGGAMEISALDGVPIRGHHGSGSLAELAVHRLLALPDAIRPDRIVVPANLSAMAHRLTTPGSSTSIDIGLALGGRAHTARISRARQTPGSAKAPGGSAQALAASAALPGPSLGRAQWSRLIAHISRLPQPHVPQRPTSAALPDNPSSPAPAAVSPSASLPLPSDGTAAPATAGQSGLEAPPDTPPSSAAGPLNLESSPLDPTTSLAAPAQTPSTPAVLLETLPAGPDFISESLVTLKLNTTLATGSIESVVFELRPDETTSWREIEGTKSPTQPYAFLNPEEEIAQDGPYELRVVVTEKATHTQYVSPAIERLIVVGESSVVKLVVPESPLRGVIKLQAEVPHGVEIEPIRFEWAPSGTNQWRPIPAPPSGGEPTNCVGTATAACFDTTTSEAPNGHDDFRAVPAGGEGSKFVSLPVRGRLVDNTPPEIGDVEPDPSGSPSSGDIALKARANDPRLPNGEAASGVVSVTFEQTRAGARAWKRVPGGLVTVPSSAGTYVRRLHTELLENGRYKLRARAVDAAGNESISQETEIEIHNTESAPAAPASITGVVAPAEDVTILGTVSASSSPLHETETWAYGITHAPPAQVEGSRLEYTAEGHQLVLLRYLEKSGWQIADVLREEGGVKPFQLVPASKLDINAAGGVQVTGSMTPSGEGWLRLIETQLPDARTIAFFHRSPGGRFEYDHSATETLKPLLEAPTAELHLGQDPAGHAFGMLTANTPEYGLLKEGAWTRETALQRPPGIPGTEPMTLRAGDVQGPGEAWGAFTVAARGHGLILGHLYNNEWHFPRSGVGLDALDLTGALASQNNHIEPEALKAEPESSAVWIGAQVSLNGHIGGQVVARYDGRTGEVTNSWCTLPVANSCEEPLGSAAVPDAFFQTERGPVAISSHGEAIDLYARGRWTSVLAPGHNPSGGDAFTGPAEGWLGGNRALGQLTAEGGSSLLTPWPLPDRSPLASIALAPGSQAAVGESGALAVGLNGAALRYESSTGWQVVPLPPRAHHLALSSVAFAGPSSAFAVGQFGLILHWDGTAWSEDPQSISSTQSQLNAVAFGPSGEGWAVGANGTILHYNGRQWSIEAPPTTDSGENISSVAVAGSEAFAVAGGNLIRRLPGGAWEEVGEALLPSNPKPVPRHLRLVAGLSDGGVIAAGRSTVLVREAAGQSFEYAEQPLSGVAVALAPFREANGKLRAYISVAPPVNELSGEVGGFPAGDGELLRETESGWQDLSRSQYAGSAIGGDGAVKSDPVLAVATDPAGEHAWVAGGYDGTEDAAHQGTTEVLSARPASWSTASIWRYDTTGNAQPPVRTSAAPSLSAKPGVVSFAFFTSPMCKVQCSAVPDAQPQVNLNAAAKQIATTAAQPGGPAFAMLGGNAVGPMEHENGAEPAADFARLHELLAPLGGLPTFAALGHFDQPNETPWSEAFAEAPEPFGSGAAAAGITPVSSGSPTPNEDVHRYYAFDANQNGATLRVITLDDTEGQLEGAATTGQRHWLEEQLAQAQGQGLAVVVIAATPLQDLKEGESLAALLASSGVLAVFTTNDRRVDERRLIPENPSPEAPQIPEYEGASLGYQKPQNNGVKWYLVSVNAQAREVHVAAIPVIASLTLKPLDGLSVARSLTLQFEAIGRRSPGTLATIAGKSEEPSEPGEPFPGYDNYVEIPAPSCGKTPCVQPSYTFTSSEPTIGDFVEPSGPGSPLPKLSSSGHPIASSTSSLFCAYNAGTTTVSITAGLLSYSLPVTVKPGGFGSPCGTVYRPGVGEVIRVQTAQTQSRLGGAAAPPPPPPAPLAGSLPAALTAPPPAPAPPPAVPAPPAAPGHAPVPAPAPVEPPLPAPIESVGTPPAILPAATPPVEPIPPGAGGYAQSPSAAERKEKARKQASQSAFSIRPAGSSGAEWFYVAVGFATLLTLLLSAQALPPGPRPRPALLFARAAGEGERRRTRRRYP